MSFGIKNLLLRSKAQSHNAGFVFIHQYIVGIKAECYALVQLSVTVGFNYIFLNGGGGGWGVNWGRWEGMGGRG